MRVLLRAMWILSATSPLEQNRLRFVPFFCVYLENGKQSILQPIHFWKDLFEIYPKMYGLWHEMLTDFEINVKDKKKNDIFCVYLENGQQSMLQPIPFWI